MRRIEYPSDIHKLGALRLDYLKCFGSAVEHYNKDGVTLSKKCKEYRWITFKKRYRLVRVFPLSVKELMVADYPALVNVYEDFQKRHLSKKAWKILNSIFNYDAYESEIANYFIARANELRLHSCFYCETAYINVYTVVGKHKKHFDLDHVLPKSKCPLVALSLFNFVPSCQICNSRIKGQKTIGGNLYERGILSPTNLLYDFESHVKFRLRPLKKPVHNFSANPNLFKVIVKADYPYNKETAFFQLEERYEYHKIEALRLKDLKQQYPKTTISKIAKLLRRPTTSVEEDIFHKSFLTSNDRCFRKFTLDMLQ
mgnify:CR=1 FL=1